jgi:general secretion pathway protein H
VHLIQARSRFKKQLGQGFTLIELLIVLVIIGVVITSLTLAVGNSGRGQAIQSAANILRARLMFAEQEAIIESTTIGFAMSQTGYQFYRVDNSVDVLSWQAMLKDDVLTYQAWPAKVTLQLQLPDNPNALVPTDLPAQPMIVFTPSGSVTPFTLKLNGFELQGTANGDIKLK